MEKEGFNEPECSMSDESVLIAFDILNYTPRFHWHFKCIAKNPTSTPRIQIQAFSLSQMITRDFSMRFSKLPTPKKRVYPNICQISTKADAFVKLPTAPYITPESLCILLLAVMELYETWYIQSPEFLRKICTAYHFFVSWARTDLSWISLDTPPEGYLSQKIEVHASS